MKEAIQEQLAAARRNQILDAAAKVFAEKGFHPTTIKDVAREAGIADGTIYIYFENKASLLLGILDRMRESVQQDAELATFAEGEFRSWMRAYLRHPLMALQADDFQLFRVVVSEVMVNQEFRALYYQKILEPTIALAEAAFQQWAERGTIKPINVSLTMRVLSGMVFGLILEQIMGDETLAANWDTLPDFLADMIVDGIGSDEA